MFGSAGVPKDLNFLFPIVASDREKEDGDAPHHQEQQQQQQQHMSGGLLKYRSVPTSNLLGEVCEDFLPHRSTSPEAAAAAPSMFPRFAGERQGEEQVARELPCSFTQLLFHSPHRQQQQQHASSMGMDHQSKEDGGLARQSSSSSNPGLFSHLSSENGFSGNRLKTQISFSSRQASSGFMSQLSEVSGEGGSGGSTDESHDARGFVSNYPVASWEDSALLSDCFNGGKRVRGEPLVKTQSGELRNNVSSSEFIAFQDSVPWKLRAKRGCATHPRSIAERVRRTKISERMRKLQELVPNMDKQTSTADMLDLAVEYVKELQDQIKRLNECKANCTCIPRQGS